MLDRAHEEPTTPSFADPHSFHKVEKWSMDVQRIGKLLFAGNSFGKARRIFQGRG